MSAYDERGWTYAEPFALPIHMAEQYEHNGTPIRFALDGNGVCWLQDKGEEALQKVSFVMLHYTLQADGERALAKQLRTEVLQLAPASAG